MEGCEAHEAQGSEGSTGQRGGEGLPWESGGTARERGSVPAKMGGFSVFRVITGSSLINEEPAHSRFTTFRTSPNQT